MVDVKIGHLAQKSTLPNSLSLCYLACGHKSDCLVIKGINKRTVIIIIIINIIHPILLVQLCLSH